MTPAKSTKKRPYQQHGFYAVSKALECVKDQEAWLDEQGPVGEALKQLRTELIAKQGGKDTITPAELMSIEGLIFAHMLMMATGRFIGEQESPVNKSRRQLFPVVTQWLTLFREVRETAKDLNTLREKRPKPEPLSLSEYLHGNGKATSNGSGKGQATKDSTAHASLSTIPAKVHSTGGSDSNQDANQTMPVHQEAP